MYGISRRPPQGLSLEKAVFLTRCTSSYFLTLKGARPDGVSYAVRVSVGPGLAVLGGSPTRSWTIAEGVRERRRRAAELVTTTALVRLRPSEEQMREGAF